MEGVIVPHGCEYFTNGAEVLLNRSLIGWFPFCREKFGTDTLSKNMEVINWVFNAFEVRGDVHPAAEAQPLAPVGGVFIEDCR